MIDPEGEALVVKPLMRCFTLVCIAIGLVLLGVLVGYFILR